MHFKKNSDEVVLKILIILANADGNYHDNEKIFIGEVANKLGISEETYSEVLEDVMQSKTDYKTQCIETLSLIEDNELRKKTLSQLTNLATADYILHEDEMLLIQIIAEKWNMFQESINE